MIDLGDWKEPLSPLFSDERYRKIREFLKYEYSHYIVYPDMYDIFNCFRFTPFANVKAVLLGQDPYHEEGQAHGLCFSVKEGVKKPPSLENMLKELKDDLGFAPPKSGDLTKWAKEGVLLLNTALTVREHQANSHAFWNARTPRPSRRFPAFSAAAITQRPTSISPRTALRPSIGI